MKRLKLTGAVLLLTAMLAGCSPEPPDPPLSRSDLVVRLFDSLKSGDYRTALEQCGKLRAIGVFSSGFGYFEDSIRYNFYVAQAQALVNAGDLPGARALLDDAVEQSLNNQQLKSQLAELDKVIALQQQLKLLRESTDPVVRRGALRALDQLLRTYPPAEIFRPEMQRVEAELAATPITPATP